jgi:hypothetical protein
VYEDHLKLKEKSEVEEKYQPCKDKRKSENKVIKERKNLDSTKIGINGSSTERGERKRRLRRKKGWKN